MTRSRRRKTRRHTGLDRLIAGMGIAPVPAQTVAAELRERHPVALGVKDLPINCKWLAVKRADKRFMPSAQASRHSIARKGKHYLPQN